MPHSMYREKVRIIRHSDRQLKLALHYNYQCLDVPVADGRGSAEWVKGIPAEYKLVEAKSASTSNPRIDNYFLDEGDLT